MEKQQIFTFILDATQQAALTEILLCGNYTPVNVPYTTIAVIAPSFGGAHINLYTNGKCFIQGGNSHDFVEFVMEPEILKATPITDFQSTLTEEAKTAHLGVDESGKGDFFGPLVVAAAFSNGNVAEQLRDAGVRDSKNISSDDMVRSIATRIHSILGTNRYHIMILPPPKYNTLYSKMRSVNRILAWYHATCIERLVRDPEGGDRLAVSLAISDQFGDEKLVLNEMRKKNLEGVELRQRHHAEEDLAVAAASILARATFVKQMRLLSEKYGIEFPKGAAEPVKKAAAALLQRHGPDAFIETAKCHFKTLDSTLENAGFTRDEMPPAGRIKSTFVSRDWKKKETGE